MSNESDCNLDLKLTRRRQWRAVASSPRYPGGLCRHLAPPETPPCPDCRLCTPV